MNTKLFAIALIFLGSTAIQAQEPEQAAEPMPSEAGSMADDMEAMPPEHARKMQEKGHRKDESAEKAKGMTSAEEESGMMAGEGHNKDASGQGPDKSKHQATKTEEDRKEAGKGSEQGQAKREEHSKKWWRFWE